MRRRRNLRSDEHFKRIKSFTAYVDKLVNRARREGKSVVIRGIDGDLVEQEMKDRGMKSDG